MSLDHMLSFPTTEQGTVTHFITLVELCTWKGFMTHKAKVEFREYFVHCKLLHATYDYRLRTAALSKLESHYADWRQILPYSLPVEHATSVAAMSAKELQIACVKDSVFSFFHFTYLDIVHICVNVGSRK